ncbi:MAG TPA: D-alanyl-D-alanine carboxypeptidase, partial [Myxococcota bacterium]|nr:D-alanyl-D-alanine carboxypeptidase [Myxococcota bacterium]
MLLAFAALPALAQDPPEGEPEVAEVVVAPVAGGLKEELAALAADPIFTSAVAGVSVVDADSGEEIWSNNDAGMMPASVMKTFTAAVALKTLGPTYRFPTWVMTDGTIEADGVLKGNLYIKGQGDPTMVV